MKNTSIMGGVPSSIKWLNDVVEKKSTSKITGEVSKGVSDVLDIKSWELYNDTMISLAELGASSDIKQYLSLALSIGNDQELLEEIINTAALNLSNSTNQKEIVNLMSKCLSDTIGLDNVIIRIAEKCWIWEENLKILKAFARDCRENN